MADIYRLLRPLLFRLEAERAHDLALGALARGWVKPPAELYRGDALRVSAFGLDFPNPVGLAAGFDKGAQVLSPLLSLGFGFVEAGTVTPKPQPGNPRPRVFRHEAAGAVINRMGFPGCGLDVFRKRLEAFRSAGSGGIVGVNIGKNKDSRDAAADYRACAEGLAGLADYLVINVSSPNTPGLRTLQRKKELGEIFAAVNAAVRRSGREVPVLLKIAPDLDLTEQQDIAAIVKDYGAAGLIVSNTTTARPQDLPVDFRNQPGGLSGRPLLLRSNTLVARMHQLTGGKLPIIGVGGIFSAEDAWAKIRAGATLVQVYTGFVFEGVSLPSRICLGLESLLKQSGLRSLAEAVGADAERIADASFEEYAHSDVPPMPQTPPPAQMKGVA